MREVSQACAPVKLLDVATLHTIPDRSQPRGPYYMREREIANPKIDGIFGTWLDDDGFVLPEFRERAAKAKADHKRSMERIEEVAVIAQARR